MSSKVKVKLNYTGVGQLLKSEEMADGISEMASQIAQRAGNGYASDVRTMGTRVVASAYTDTARAMADNLSNNTLLKAVK